MDRDTITALTIAVRVYRQLRAMGIYDMPIKWNITAKATKARGLMDQISTEYDGFIETGSDHLADVKGLRSQVGDMQDDLQAAANVMGNASGDGGKPGHGAAEPQKPPVVPPNVMAAVGDRNEPKAAPAPIVGQAAMPETTEGAIWLKSPRSQEAGETPATTFPRDL